MPRLWIGPSTCTCLPGRRTRNHARHTIVLCLLTGGDTFFKVFISYRIWNATHKRFWYYYYCLQAILPVPLCLLFGRSMLNSLWLCQLLVCDSNHVTVSFSFIFSDHSFIPSSLHLLLLSAFLNLFPTILIGIFIFSFVVDMFGLASRVLYKNFWFYQLFLSSYYVVQTFCLFLIFCEWSLASVSTYS